MNDVVSSEVSKYSRETIEKVSRLEQMNEVMKSMNNENCYYHWIYLVPDEATEADFRDIAIDESSYEECCELYDDLYTQYREDGLYKPSASAVNFAKATDKRLNLKDIEVFY